MPAEVEGAKAHFTMMREKGYAAFKVNADLSKGEIIRDFDPQTKRIARSIERAWARRERGGA